MNSVQEKAEQVLGEVWRWLMDGMNDVSLSHCLTFVEAYERAEVIDKPTAELWRLRMKFECPEGKGNHIGGRAWCAYCGNTPEKFEEHVS